MGTDSAHWWTKKEIVIVAVSIVAFGALLAVLIQRFQAERNLAAQDNLRRQVVFFAILFAWMLIETAIGWLRRPRTQQPTGPFGPITHLHWRELRRIFAIGAALLLLGLAWVARVPTLELVGAAGFLLVCVPLFRLLLSYGAGWLLLGHRIGLDFHVVQRRDPAFFSGEIDGVRLAIFGRGDRRYRISVGSDPHTEITQNEITLAAQAAGLSDLAWPEFDDWCGERDVGPDARIRKLPSIHGSTHCVTFRGRLQDAERFVRTLLAARSTPGRQDNGS